MERLKKRKDIGKKNNYCKEENILKEEKISSNLSSLTLIDVSRNHIMMSVYSIIQ